MARTFNFTPAKGLESISGAPTNKGPGDLVIASGNSSLLVDNPLFKTAEVSPAMSPAAAPKFQS